MSIDKSLRRKNQLARARSVLTRDERIKALQETDRWTEGRSLVFDDTYEHEAWNETGATRVVLFVDVVRPLREPMRTFNAVVIKVIGWSPFIQDAKRRHREWERQFLQATGSQETGAREAG